MKLLFILVALTVLVWLGLTFPKLFLSFTDLINSLHKTDSTFYVWTVSGINLRAQPSISAAVVKKLPYGTPVTVFNQDKKPISYPFVFFSVQADTNPQVVLPSQWIKVKAAQQEGYVLDKTLLSFVPCQPHDHIESCLIRVFKLTKQQREKKSQLANCGDSYTRYTSIEETFTSPHNQVLLKTTVNDGDECTRGEHGEVLIPGLSFEKAFIFFNAILPPEVVNATFNYQADEVFGYSLDAAASANADLKKTKNGVHFEWDFGEN
jgi:hypothetical protein